MDKEYLLENLTIDDLEESQKLLFNIIGKERFVEMCLAFAGNSICIPKENTLNTAIAKRKIREGRGMFESGAVTMKQLAMRYKVSLSIVYSVLREKK